LRGGQNETIVKELSVASAASSDTFRFKPPYKMAYHGSAENGINWIDDHIGYRELYTFFNEAVASFAHLYACGFPKCSFLARMTGQPVHKLEDLKCPHPNLSIMSVGVPRTATSLPNSISQPNRAFFLYDWLIY